MKPITLVKLGGVAASDPRAIHDLGRDIAALDGPAAIVHGGGAELSEISRSLGHEPVFADGIRLTSEPEMDVVNMVLGGLVNARLVRALVQAGLQAVGVAGSDAGMVTGTQIEGPDGALSRTATISGANPLLLRDLWISGYTPVIAPPSATADGVAVNINADDVALGLAAAMQASFLVFLSDVEGVVIDGDVVNSLTPLMAEAQIASQEISGGMIPKVRNAAGALEQGVGHVVIGNYERAGDLERLLGGAKGTTILKQEDE